MNFGLGLANEDNKKDKWRGLTLEFVEPIATNLPWLQKALPRR